MADLIEVPIGSEPWEPNASRLVTVYHHYNIPLIGVVEQGGTEYLFQCLAESADVSFWSYSCLETRERQQLDESSDDDEFEDYLPSHAHRPGVLALVVENHGVVGAESYDDWNDITGVIDRLDQRFKQWASGVNQGLDSARITLVGAH